MNRNNERHFLNVPQVHTSRTRFNRDQTILTTFDSGKLIPFFVDEVLPGDTFQIDTSAIIRMTTPKYPVMDDAFIDFYYFYCPNRILWAEFKNFMGEANESPWMPPKEYKVPTIKINGTKEKPQPLENSILDYMGVPTKIEGTFSVNALPMRAYVRIWNEYFRDQNVDNWAWWTNSSDEGTYSDNGEGTDAAQILNGAFSGGRCLPVNKFHDYFTSCMPYPERGPEVTLPLTGNAAVNLFSDQELTQKMSTGIDGDIYLNSTEIGNNTSVPRMSNWPTASNKGHPVLVNGAPSDNDASTYRAGFLGADLTSVAATTINELRKQLQCNSTTKHWRVAAADTANRSSHCGTSQSATKRHRFPNIWVVDAITSA